MLFLNNKITETIDKQSFLLKPNLTPPKKRGRKPKNSKALINDVLIEEEPPGMITRSQRQ